jgi:hypothetical protein
MCIPSVPVPRVKNVSKRSCRSNKITILSPTHLSSGAIVFEKIKGKRHYMLFSVFVQ